MARLNVRAPCSHFRLALLLERCSDSGAAVVEAFLDNLYGTWFFPDRTFRALRQMCKRLPDKLVIIWRWFELLHQS